MSEQSREELHSASGQWAFNPANHSVHNAYKFEAHSNLFNVNLSVFAVTPPGTTTTIRAVSPIGLLLALTRRIY